MKTVRTMMITIDVTATGETGAETEAVTAVKNDTADVALAVVAAGPGAGPGVALIVVVVVLCTIVTIADADADVDAATPGAQAEAQVEAEPAVLPAHDTSVALEMTVIGIWMSMKTLIAAVRGNLTMRFTTRMMKSKLSKDAPRRERTLWTVMRSNGSQIPGSLEYQLATRDLAINQWLFIEMTWTSLVALWIG
jgi:hypothetical protein